MCAVDLPWIVMWFVQAKGSIRHLPAPAWYSAIKNQIMHDE